MQIDFAAHIEKLLFLHDTLSIPSFGGFTVNRAAASADYVGGAVYPPTKTLAFNENLTADDGLLVQDVATTHALSTEEARRVVQEFVDKMQQQLDQREIVTLSGIGRLYKNYVQKIQFLPDTTNFDPEAYGLPPLQFSPIARSRGVEETAAATNNTTGTTSGASNGAGAGVAPPPPSSVATPPPGVPASPAAPPVTPATPAPAYEPGSGSSRVLAFFAVLLLLLAVALGIWWMRRPAAGPETADNTASDSIAIIRPGETSGAAGSDDEESERTVAPRGSNPTPATERQPSTAKSGAAAKPKPRPETASETAEGRSCILVIATLREQNNADRLINLLETNGYEVYQLQRNGTYQVGIQFRYRELAEIQEKMVALQKLTGEQEIWIKKR